MFDHIRNASDHLALAEGCEFVPEWGEYVCNFIEKTCCQSKGRWAGQPLTLLDWQRDFIMRLFGWRRADGTRRFRTVYLEVAKKNGKSTLLSALAIELAVADGEGAPEVYLNAVDREQAGIVFDEAARMVAKSPELSRRLKTTKFNGRITDPIGYGKIQKNSADAPSKDGVNASVSIFDELHRFKSRELWDVFEYAGASREQPLKIVITTAGEEEEGPWHDQREFSEKVNEGVIPNTTHLGVVYRALLSDDLDDPATWLKANPSLGVTISQNDFAREWEEAKIDAAKRANFMRLRLNIVVRSEGKFLELSDWDECSAPTSLATDEPCYMGLDLSDRDDLSALVFIVGDPTDGFDVECRFWLPEQNIVDLERRHQQPYRTWADKGLIILTPGDTIDYDFIEEEIVGLAASRNLVKLFSDPWNAYKLAENLLNKHGLPVEYLRQGYASISDPTKTLKEWVKGGKLRHGGHPILRWHASNAVIDQDAAGNIKLNKKKSKKKIDGMAALVNAVAGVIVDPDTGPSVYETRGVVYI